MQKVRSSFLKLLLLITLNFKFYFTPAGSISFFPYGTIRYRTLILFLTRKSALPEFAE